MLGDMRAVAFVVLLLSLDGCAGRAGTPGTVASKEAPAARGPYLGQIAGERPQVFAPGLVSRPYPELNAAFSPSGDEFFYALADPSRSHYTLLRMVRGPDGAWSPPEVAPFSGRYSDADPIFSADGRRIYFISERPLTPAGAAKDDFDIWYVDRAGAGWGQPVNLGAPINTAKDEYYVSITRERHVYWSRDGDIYRAVLQGGRYVVEKLDENVNHPVQLDSDPFVSPDESYLLFVSWGRPDGIGSGDLYVSFRVDGRWQKAQPLAPGINSRYLEYCPIVSPDGTHFFFTSTRKVDQDPTARTRTLAELLAEFDRVNTEVENGLGNVYWMKADFIETLRPREATAR
jgi:hypothetical protein